MASAINLTRLHLDCLVHPWGGQQHMARKFFSDAHHWLEAVGSARGRRDAAVDIVDLGQQNFRNPFNSGTQSGQQANPSKPRDDREVSKRAQEVVESLRRCIAAGKRGTLSNRSHCYPSADRMACRDVLRSY